MTCACFALALFIWPSVAVAHSVSQLTSTHHPTQVYHVGAAERAMYLWPQLERVWNLNPEPIPDLAS